MQDFLSTVILLFIVIDPVGLAPMIQGMLKKYSPAQQKAILMRELVFALSLLLLFFFSGKFLLDLLGLEPSTLNISGGILLFLVALGMVFPAKDMLSSAGRTTGQDEPFIVPIAMPLMAGPSSLAIIMLHASQSPDSISQMTYAGAIVTAWFLSGLVLFIAQKFLRLLGEKGTICADHAGYYHRHCGRDDHCLGHERLYPKNHGTICGPGQQQAYRQHLQLDDG